MGLTPSQRINIVSDLEGMGRYELLEAKQGTAHRASLSPPEYQEFYTALLRLIRHFKERTKMGIRMLQWIGLNDRAQKIIVGESVVLWWDTVSRRFPDGRVVNFPEDAITGSTVKRESSGETYSDPFSDEPNTMSKWTFPDGHVLFEKVQADPWSSGPCVFTALQDEKGEWVKESLWTDEEIEKET